MASSLTSEKSTSSFGVTRRQKHHHVFIFSSSLLVSTVLYFKCCYIFSILKDTKSYITLFFFPKESISKTLNIVIGIIFSSNYQLHLSSFFMLLFNFPVNFKIIYLITFSLLFIFILILFYYL